ncbi:uncharacterized protein LOC143459128 isoform X1 [Clavelina lepadiformis]|uniref:uncharacterized protein LOC143459128 isoform X1 n=1 Tax=Clavelina lepadiformis TaxID=159417 RepID=UPI0040425941
MKEVWMTISLIACCFARRIETKPKSFSMLCTESSKTNFAPGQTYIYQYETSTVSRITGTSDQQSGSAGFNSRIKVLVLSKCEHVITFENVESNTMSAQSNLRELLSRYPLQVNWQDGRIHELYPHQEENTWVLNIKRGFLSAMQNSFSRGQEEGKELDVVGNCETRYRQQDNGATITVRKTKDLMQCANDRSTPYTSVLYVQYQADSSRQSLLASTQDCNQTWTKEGILRQTSCREEHLFRPLSYRGNRAQTTVTQKLRLMSQQSENNGPTPFSERKIRRTTLAYEEILSKGTEDVNSDTFTLTTAIEDACDLINANAPTETMPSAFLQVVTEMKRLNKTSIRFVWDAIEAGNICRIQQEKIRQMFLDAIPMCDKDACVEFAIDMIKSNAVKLDQKSAWISALSMVSKPTKKTIAVVLDLIRSPEPTTETFLTLGTLVYRFCLDHKSCMKYDVVSEVVAFLKEPLGVNCHTTDESQNRRIILSLKALGNAAVTTDGSVLNSCISEKRNSPTTRLAAIASFRRQACASDRFALREILSDASEDSEIRIAAYSALMQCPSFEVVRLVINLMQSEEVNQVGSYIWRHVMEIGQSADPLKQYMKKLFSISDLSDKFSKDKQKFSGYYEKSLYFETLNLGAELDGDLVWSTTSFIPRSARLNLTVDVFGAAFNLFEIGGRVQGLERQLERMFGPSATESVLLSAFLGFKSNEGSEKNKRGAISNYDRKLEEIERRHQQATPTLEEPSASVFFRMFGNELAFSTFQTEIAESIQHGSWFEGIQMLYKLITGSDWSFQHHRLLADSKIVVPTMSGLPLTLDVTGISTLDVSVGGQMDLNKIFFEGFYLTGRLKPKGAVEISATMSIDIGPLTKAGIELKTTLSTSLNINGTVSLVQGENFRLRIDVPQDQMDVISFKSNLFVFEENERSQIVSSSPEKKSSWCSDDQSHLLGIQLCIKSSRSNPSNMADDMTPFFPLAGHADYKFNIRKTDPNLTHYLIETGYGFHPSPNLLLPEQLNVYFFIGTPGSSVNRDARFDLAFAAYDDNISCRLATSQRSLLIQANRHVTESEKSADITVTIDNLQTYRVEGNMAYEKSRIGGHLWNGRAQILTPNLKANPPTITGLFAFSGDGQIECRIDLTNVLVEPIILRGDATVSHVSERRRYSGSGQVTIPGYLNIEGQLLITSKDGSDKTHFGFSYELLGLPQHFVELSYKQIKNQEKWNIATEVSTSQFPPLNHKILLKQENTNSVLESSLTIDYGAQYNEKSNTNKFAIKQLLTNRTTKNKFHLEGLWSLSVPSFDVDYKANLKHISDWSTAGNNAIVFSGAFRSSRHAQPLYVHFTMSNKSSKHKLNLEMKFMLSTPWGDISSLQILTQPTKDRYNASVNFGLRRAVGLQLQMNVNVTNESDVKKLLLHLHRPQSAAIGSQSEEYSVEDIFLIRPSSEDILFFATQWSKTEAKGNGYRINVSTILQSQWNRGLSMNASVVDESLATSTKTVTKKRVECTLSQDDTYLGIVAESIKEKMDLNSSAPNSVVASRSLLARVEWKDFSHAVKHVEVNGKLNRVSPKFGAWSSTENRIDIIMNVTRSANMAENQTKPFKPNLFGLKASVFAHPISQTECFDLEHTFGFIVDVNVPNTSINFSFNQELEVRFSNYLDMAVVLTLEGNLPPSLLLNPPITSYHLVKNFRVNPNGQLISANFLLDNVEAFHFNATFHSEDNSLTSDLQWMHNPRKFLGLFKMLPQELCLKFDVQKTKDIINFSQKFQSLFDLQSITFAVRGKINLLQNEAQLVIMQKIPTFTELLSLPRELVIRANSTNSLSLKEITVAASVDGTNLIRAGTSVNIPSSTSQLIYRIRFVLEQTFNVDLLPSTFESIAILAWNPLKKYALELDATIESSSVNSRLGVELPLSGRGTRVNFSNVHSFQALKEAGFPIVYEIGISRSDEGDDVEFSYRADDRIAKVNLKLSHQAVTKTNSYRSSLTVDISHNSKRLLREWNIPLQFKSVIRMDENNEDRRNQRNTSLSWTLNLVDKSFRTTLTLIANSNNEHPFAFEFLLSGAHDIGLLKAKLPEDFEFNGSIRKVHSGLTFRISRSLTAKQLFFETTAFAHTPEGVLSRADFVLEVSHNFPILSELFRRRFSTSITLEKVKCFCGFNVAAGLAYDDTNTLKTELHLDCNDTSVVLSFQSNTNIANLQKAGVPAEFLLVSEIFSHSFHKTAGYILRVSKNGKKDHLYLKVSDNNQAGNSDDQYKLELSQSFQELKSVYNVPYNLLLTFSGKVEPWQVAEGRVNITVDRLYKFLKFKFGYLSNAEDQYYSFHYLLCHNLAANGNDGLLDQRLTAEVRFDLYVDGSGYDIVYQLEHSIDSLKALKIPTDQQIKLSVILGTNNTVGLEFISSCGSRFSFSPKIIYKPGDSDESLTLTWTSRNGYQQLPFPSNVISSLSVVRNGDNQMTGSVYTIVNEKTFRITASFLNEAESYKYVKRRTLQVSLDPTTLLAPYFDVMPYQKSITLTVSQLRNGNRQEADLIFSTGTDEDFHATFSSEGLSATFQQSRTGLIALEISSNVEALQNFGIPQSMHGTLNFRLTAESSGISLNLGTNSGKHIDVDVTFTNQVAGSYDFIYTTSQNFEYLGDTVQYPQQFQATVKVVAEAAKLSVRSRLMLDQQTRFIQLVVNMPILSAESYASRQISRSLYFSHDFATLSEVFNIPREFEVNVDLTTRQTGGTFDWSSLGEINDIRLTLAINIEQSSIIEKSLTYRFVDDQLESILTLQQNISRLLKLGLPSFSRLEVQAQIKENSQLYEMEVTFGRKSRSPVHIALLTTKQEIVKGTKRALHEASLSLNHNAEVLSDLFRIPTNTKLTLRRVLRKISPSFEVGATLWVGREQLDIFVELDKVNKGYSLYLASTQDVDVLLQLGISRDLDVTITRHSPLDGYMQGGTIRISTRNNYGASNSLSATLTHDARFTDFVNIQFEHDFPLLKTMSVPEDITGLLSAENKESIVIISLKGCADKQCIRASFNYTVNHIENTLSASSMFLHNLFALERYDIPSNMSFQLQGHARLQRAGIKLSTRIGQSQMKMAAGLNLTLHSSEWNFSTEFFHNFDILQLMLQIPSVSHFKLSYNKPSNDDREFKTSFIYGNRGLSAIVAVRTTMNPNFFRVDSSVLHSLEVLASMEIPMQMKVTVSVDEVLHGYRTGFLFQMNRFVLNTTGVVYWSDIRGLNVRIDNKHNMSQLLLLRRIYLAITVGAIEDSGYVGEIKILRNQKKNVIRLTARGESSGRNSRRFSTTLEQDFTADFDTASIWYNLASKIELHVQARANYDNNELQLHVVVEDKVLDINLEKSRQSDQQWEISGNITQSLDWIKNSFPGFPGHISISGEIRIIPKGYRTTVDLEYNEKSNSFQLQTEYLFNEDTRRNESVLSFRHNVAEWVSEYNIPLQAKVTAYSGKEDTSKLSSVSFGCLVQFDEYQAHLSLQGTTQDVIMSDLQMRTSVRVYINSIHDWSPFSSMLNIPRNLKLSLETIPLRNGVTLEVINVKDETENRASATVVCGWDDGERRNIINLQFSHDMNELCDIYRVPLRVHFLGFVNMQANYYRAIAGWIFSVDDRFMEQSLAYDIESSLSFDIKIVNEIRNLANDFAFFLPSTNLSFSSQLHKMSLCIIFNQTIGLNMRSVKINFGYMNDVQKRLFFSINHNIARLLKDLLIPEEFGIVLCYHITSGERVFDVDVACGARKASASAKFRRKRNRFKITFESQHNVLNSSIIPETLHLLYSVRWTQTLLRTAFESDFGDVGPQRARFAISCGVKKSWKSRMEFKAQLIQNTDFLIIFGVPRESNLLLFFSRPKAKVYTMGININFNLQLLHIAGHLKVRNFVQMSLSMRFRQNIPALTEEWNVPEAKKLDIASTWLEDPVSYYFVLKSTNKGEAPKHFSFSLDFNKTLSKFNSEISTSHDFSVLERWWPSEVSVLTRFDSSGNEMSTQAEVFFGDETLSAIAYAGTNPYEIQCNIQHNIAGLEKIWLPNTVNGNMTFNFAVSSSAVRAMIATQNILLETSELSLDFVYSIGSSSTMNTAFSHNMKTLSTVFPSLIQHSLFVDVEKDLSVRNVISTENGSSNFSATITYGVNNEDESRKEVVVAVMHNMRTLNELQVPLNIRICWHYLINQGVSSGVIIDMDSRSTFEATFVLPSFTNARLEIYTALHHNHDSLAEGATYNLTVWAKELNVFKLKSVLIRDYEQSTPCILEATFGKTEENLLHYEFKAFTNDNTLSSISVLLDVKNMSETYTNSEIKFSFSHSLEELEDFFPSEVDIQSNNLFNFKDQRKWEMKTNTTYTTSNDKELQFMFGASGEIGQQQMVSSSKNVQMLSSFKNFPFLSELLKTEDDSNKMQITFKYDYVFPVLSSYKNLIYAQKSLVLSASGVGRFVELEGFTKKSVSDNKFTSSEASISVNHAMNELTSLAIPSSLSFRTSSVSYADSANVDVILSWHANNSMRQTVNGTMQYDGELPARVLGSHTFYAELNQPFADLPELLTLTGNMQLTDSHYMSDWRINYAGEDQIYLHQRLEGTQLGRFEADFIFKQPDSGFPVTNLDIATSLSSVGLTKNIFGRIVLNKNNPDQFSGTVIEPHQGSDIQKRFLAKLTLQPGAVSQYFIDYNETIFTQIDGEVSETGILFAFNGCSVDKVMVVKLSANTPNTQMFTTDMIVKHPFNDVMPSNLQWTGNICLAGELDFKAKRYLRTKFLINTSLLENPNRITGKQQCCFSRIFVSKLYLHNY